MKFLALLLFPFVANCQALIVPSNPDSIKHVVNYAGAVRTAWNIDLMKNHVGKADSTLYSTKANATKIKDSLIGVLTSGYAPLISTGYNSTNYSFRLGSFVLQPYALNNEFIAENSFFNGTNWVKISNGYASAFQFYNGQILFLSTNTGTGIYNPVIPLKTDFSNSGTVALGGSIAVAPNDYTGAKLIVSGNSGTVANSNLTFAVDNAYDIGASGANRPRNLYVAQTINSNGSILSGNSFIPNIYGGLNTVSGNLILNSTSNATKGKILFGASGAYDEANVRLGIGTASPSTALHVSGSDNTGNAIVATVENIAASGSVYAGFTMKTSGSTDGNFFAGKTVNNGFGLVNGVTFSAGTASQDVAFRTGVAVSGTATGPTVVLKSSGNLLINSGTDDNTNKLQVAGSINSTTGNTGYVNINPGGQISIHSPGGANNWLGTIAANSAGLVMSNITTTGVNSIGGSLTFTAGGSWDMNFFNGASLMAKFAGSSRNLLINTSTDVATAVVNIASTTAGVLFPRMTTTQRTAITLDATNDGLMVYDITLHKLYLNENGTWAAK